MKNALRFDCRRLAGSAEKSTRRICLFGAAPDTGNLGVSALCYSILSGLHKASPKTIVTVFDHARGARHDEVRLEHGAVRFRRRGAAHCRRYHRPDTLWNMRVAGW